MAEQALRVLLVESETNFGDRAAKLFRQTYHYAVVTAADAESAWESIVHSEPPFDMVLLDDR
jgi:hypothetical protein